VNVESCAAGIVEIDPEAEACGVGEDFDHAAAVGEAGGVADGEDGCTATGRAGDVDMVVGLTDGGDVAGVDWVGELEGADVDVSVAFERFALVCGEGIKYAGASEKTEGEPCGWGAFRPLDEVHEVEEVVCFGLVVGCPGARARGTDRA